MKQEDVEELKTKLEGKRVIVQHKEGSAVDQNFSNSEKHGVVENVCEYSARNELPFPVKIRLDEDRCATWVQFYEINQVLS